MIVIFPILTDESISQTVVPGLCKSLEKFLLIYEMDAISKMIGEKVLKIGGVVSSIALARKMTQQNEGIFLIKEDNSDKDDEKDYHYPEVYVAHHGRHVQTKKYRETGDKLPRPHDDIHDDANQWNKIIDQDRKRISNQEAEEDKKTKKARETVKNVFDFAKGIRDIGTVNFDLSQSNSLSLEPTYAIATTSTGTKIIGIKVIPVKVKNSKGLSLTDLMVSDLSLDFLHSKLTSYKRKIIRAFWAICRGIRVPFLSGKANQVISGDPEKDILLASTFHRKYVFCLLNFADMTDSEFFKNAGGIHKLHSLGWNSIIAADDVNKRVFWCMKQFHGLCSTTPYSFVYSSLGKDQAKAYTDLETVTKTASSIFKANMSFAKIFGESTTIINNYLKRIN